MSLRSAFERARRLAKKPPGYLVHRIAREANMEADRLFAPLVPRRFTAAKLAAMAGFRTIDELWRHLAGKPFPAVTRSAEIAAFSERFPEARQKILAAAERAIGHRIDLLGTGPIDLGETIDWLCDFKTGYRWEPGFCRSIDYLNKGRPSDVKVPWELSRIQWMLPAGQAYLLTGDERYALAVRNVLDQWISANPFAWTVNWSCTMEPALRILSWTWLFHVFALSESWKDQAFRARFLSMLYLHGLFTEKHVERSTINGNHLTADATGLVFAGLFFQGLGTADRWQNEGWRTLENEIALQVHPDGVDFEASSAYHRLVAELFLLSARYRLACDLQIPEAYSTRLLAMGKFIAAYSRLDGTSPNWGDADDARALPLGTQPLSDHRYLTGLIALTFDDSSLMEMPWGVGDEIAWHDGLNSLSRKLPDRPLRSSAFRDGGVYILRNDHNHVFIDCGPVGLAGLGGHGHNDALSFEAWLGDSPLILDPGSFVYTASIEERNAFRSTDKHNSPMIDGQEINRFVAFDNLWNLHDDAKAELISFESTPRGGHFVGRHRGYGRLDGAVDVTREITLEGETLSVVDMISGGGTRCVSIPIHFAPDVDIQAEVAGTWRLMAAKGKAYRLNFTSEAPFEATIECTRVSPSYGVAIPAKRLVWRTKTNLPIRVTMSIAPLSDNA
jgi:hypothetical protein